MDEEVDHRMADALAALANPTRLSLLRALRSPKVLAEIEIGSADREHGPNIARQTVRKHLDRLIAAGLVATRDVEREGRDTVEFLLNNPVVFSLSDEVRALARLRPTVEPFGATAEAASSDRSLGKGPALVVVRGLEEGTTFPLAPSGQVNWTIGRRRDCDVPLDFDPFVSGQNSMLHWTGGAHEITDLGSRNGTSINFRPLATDEVRALRHGDVVGVGHSLLLYWS